MFEPPIPDCDKIRFHRTASIQAFNKRSHANEMLNGLRYFERPQKTAEGKQNECRDCTVCTVTVLFELQFAFLFPLKCPLWPRASCFFIVYLWQQRSKLPTGSNCMKSKSTT